MADNDYQENASGGIKHIFLPPNVSVCNIFFTFARITFVSKTNIFGATFNVEEHGSYWTETYENYLSKNYMQIKFPKYKWPNNFPAKNIDNEHLKLFRSLKYLYRINI